MSQPILTTRHVTQWFLKIWSILVYMTEETFGVTERDLTGLGCDILVF